MNPDQNNNYVLKRNRTTSIASSSTRKRRRYDQSPLFDAQQSSDAFYSESPRILLKRIIHVKDEDEQLVLPSSHPITLNMAQATEQMTEQNDTRPKILLHRVTFEQ